MDEKSNASKPERFAEFLRRLDEAPAASTFGEAYQQIADVLNAVEDEMTSIPFDPANWMTDGRMYPPQMDSLREIPGRDDLRYFRSKGHRIFVGDNGSIRIETLAGAVEFSKVGGDGQDVNGANP